MRWEKHKDKFAKTFKSGGNFFAITPGNRPVLYKKAFGVMGGKPEDIRGAREWVKDTFEHFAHTCGLETSQVVHALITDRMSALAQSIMRKVQNGKFQAPGLTDITQQTTLEELEKALTEKWRWCNERMTTYEKSLEAVKQKKDELEKAVEAIQNSKTLGKTKKAVEIVNLRQKAKTNTKAA